MESKCDCVGERKSIVSIGERAQFDLLERKMEIVSLADVD